jgi:AhpD family alkylhydroperoxidase
MDMSRIAIIDEPQAPLLARRFYRSGDPGAIVATLAHVPEMLEAAMPFLAAVLGPSSLAPRLKEIIILRTSSLLGCRYCIQSHSATALDCGLSRDDVLALRGVLPLDDCFSDARERAMLAWIECVATGCEEMPDDVRARLGLHFSDAEVVEITLVAATTIMLNRYCTSLSLPSAPATLARLSDEGLL